MISSLLDLIYPKWCVGCGAWDEYLCPDCAKAFSRHWVSAGSAAPYLRHIDPHGGGDISPFPVVALAPYAGRASRIIVSWKHQANLDLDRAMARLLPPFSNGGRDQFPALGSGPVAVVPAPSKPSRKRNGLFVAEVVARRVAELGGWTYSDMLRKPGSVPLRFRAAHRFRVAQLGDRQAKQNMYAVGEFHGDAIVVDDVLTTGSTLLGSAKALAKVGARTVGAVVLAVAEDPRRQPKR